MARKTANNSLVAIRNTLRPFFNRTKPLRRDQHFQKIRTSARDSDLPIIYAQIEENRAYQFSGLGNTYPATSDNIPDVSLSKLTPLALRREVSLQIYRLNHHSQKIVLALDSLHSINTAIENEEWEHAEVLIDAHKADYGFSILINKKELLVAFQRHGIPGLSKRYKGLTHTSERRAWALICKLTYDLVDPANHPVRNTKHLLALLASRPNANRWYVAPIFWETLGFSNSKASIADTLLRYNSVSLLDMIMFLWRSDSVHGKTWADTPSFIPGLDQSLVNTLQNKFQIGHIPQVTRYLTTDRHLTGVDLYRLSFFFDEYRNVAKWRSEIASLLYADGIAEEDRKSVDSGELQQLVKEQPKIFSDELTTKIAVVEWLRAVVSDTNIVAEQSFFSTALVAEIFRNISLEDADAGLLISALARFPELQESLEIAAFMRLAKDENLKQDGLLSFLLRDFIFRRDRSQDNDLERRAAFMKMFLIGGRQAIVPFLEGLKQEFALAAEYTAKVCSRTFLEKLYLLMTSVKDVIETRIDICNWLVASSDVAQESLGEELTSLRQELSNLDARSDLDSTRVHVDEEALREWYQDTQYSPSIRYSQTVAAEGPEYRHESFVSFYRRLQEENPESEEGEDFLLDTQIGSQFVFLELVESTLRAFVSDKTFGMDAYLSRRIRHGTLSGFLITPLARVTQRIRDATIAETRTGDIDDYIKIQSVFDEWRSALSLALDHVRREMIQIRTDTHPDGLIEASWRSGSGVTYLDAMLSRVRPRVSDSGSAYNLFSDIHSLCWDLVERDLAKIRLYLYSDFYKTHADRLGEAFFSLTSEQKNIAHSFFIDAQKAFLNRVQEICGWFIRPVVRRDKYDLATLVDSTVSIIRELDVGYTFKEVITVERNLEINRGSFEVIGDVLFVLLGNAAKHGMKGGNVFVSAERKEQEVPSVILEITSQTEDAPSHKNAMDRIKKAFQVDDQTALESAAVGEGFSGIRKLVGLLSRVRNCSWTVSHDEKDRLVIFEIVLPLEITFRRERT